MKKVELLAPCGNMESLKYAVLNGADAVYFGGANFGARKYAQNFTDEEIVEAIKFCHLYGVKAYVTVNILVFESELEECTSFVRFLHENNVDAIIVQDIGLISYLRKKFPNLEIHASTQAHNHNKNGIEFLKKLGVKRVVLARELSLDEIKSIDCDIEKEVFVHGALCISYSGCCLFSSMNGNRSGNRGSCTGLCRLPYTLLENDKNVITDYVLSTKSLCTIENIDKLIESGITSFKIEGRMKSKEYTGYVTRLYRQKIDEYYLKKSFDVKDFELDNLKKLYNREFTKGFLFEKDFKSIMNIKSSNHIGTKLGYVIDVNKKYIKVKLTDDVFQEDGVRFDNDKGMILNKLYNEKGLLVNKVSKGNICLFDNKIGLIKSKYVRKTIDSNLVKMIDETTNRKINIKLCFTASQNEKIKLTISDYEKNLTFYGQEASVANNIKMKEIDIKKHLDRFKDTPFNIKEFIINLDDNLFIPVKEINNLRRMACEALIKEREGKKPYPFKENATPIFTFSNKKKEIALNVLVRNEVQLLKALSLGVSNIYVDNLSLYRKYEKYDNIYYRTPRVNISDVQEEKILTSDIGMLKYAKDKKIVTDSYMNITNSKGIELLVENGVKLVCLSYENSFENIKMLSKYSSVLEIPIYGRVEVMVMKYCPMKMIINMDKTPCTLCKNNKYSLKDKDGFIYPIRTRNHLTILYHKDVTSRIEYLKEYLALGFTNFRIDFFEEDEREVERIIRSII